MTQRQPGRPAGAPERVLIYDTTLRDGCQAQGINFTVEDKLRIAQLLDEWGVAYIEGGWPNRTAPRDREFFRRAREVRWKNARICAFGSTRRAGISVEDDENLRYLIEAGAPVVTIYGKTWTLHVTDVLRTTVDENLRMIEESVAFLKAHGVEVVYDAEHFFDGYFDDSSYALETLEAAVRGGASWLVLCDTNGGTMPYRIREAAEAVRERFSTPLGIHCHDDTGLAVANSIEAVVAGAEMVQGTINGYGERCGNANLCTVVPNLELKLGVRCLPEGALAQLVHVSRTVSEMANLPPEARAPYVGTAAFAHKGGAHVNAVLKNPRTFEHVPPEAVGNEREILVSDYSGSSTILHKLHRIWPELDRHDPDVERVLLELKRLEHEGYEFEAAEASFELLARRLRNQLEHFFELVGYRVIVDRRPNEPPYAEATIKVRVDEREVHTAADGTGPVHALDLALRKAVGTLYPKLRRIRLLDYKVRVLDATRGTATSVRVLVTATDGRATWTTVGVHDNIIEASWQALVDSVIYGLMLNGEGPEDVEQAGGPPT
ncbi:MAG: citramalate synthase [Armatimonadetes bacterium]|nr:citramalate synthase [Armatimonadota bacterium]